MSVRVLAFGNMCVCVHLCALMCVCNISVSGPLCKCLRGVACVRIGLCALSTYAGNSEKKN